MDSRKYAFLVWPDEYQLSEQLAKALGFKLKLIQARKWHGLRLPLCFRYTSQSIRTIHWLFSVKPRLVFIQNPPVMACLIVFLFSLLYPGTKFAIDHHSVFFREKKWRFFHPLMKLVAKRSILNTAHNIFDLRTLKNWNVVAKEMQFINPDFDLSAISKTPVNVEWQAMLDKYPVSVFMVNRFAVKDDEYETVFAAARKKPEWLFIITGDYLKTKNIRPSSAPANALLTGYIKHDLFLRLLQSSSVVLSLTLREKTILWSIREAMALGKVFVTSDTKALRTYFESVGIFARRKNPNDLIRNIEYALANSEKQKKKIRDFLKTDQKRVAVQIKRLKRIINSVDSQTRTV